MPITQSPQHLQRRIAITTGEPAGIGPDLCVQLCQQTLDCEPVLIGDSKLLFERAQQLGLPLQLKPLNPKESARKHRPGCASLFSVTTRHPVQAGKLEPDNASYVLETLDAAVQLCMERQCLAMLTAPIHKGIINQSGIPFTGHTEYLAQRCNTKQVVMMLVSPTMRVALATTHIPLYQVPKAITAESLTSTITILHKALNNQFGIDAPHIRVCGLNPHAGEGGHLGKEEIETITPVLDQLRSQGFDLEGPVSADTAFISSPGRQPADAILAMYHDQGLAPLKTTGFGKAVNVTLGLPIIRTSVDHGTALDLAGKGGADQSSLRAALELALTMKPA